MRRKKKSAPESAELMKGGEEVRLLDKTHNSTKKLQGGKEGGERANP